MKQNIQQPEQRVDLREVKFVEGAGLVRIGPEEWGPTERETADRINKLTEAIITKHGLKNAI